MNRKIVKFEVEIEVSGNNITEDEKTALSLVSLGNLLKIETDKDELINIKRTIKELKENKPIFE
jgi:hypothetical protein